MEEELIEHIDDSGQEPEWEPPPDSRLWKTTKVLVGLMLIAGLMYVSGIYQFFFYSKTPAGVNQVELASIVDATTLTVPLNVFIISPDNASEPARDEADVRLMADKAERIWNQASIDLSITGVKSLALPKEKIDVFYSNPNEFIYSLPDFDAELVTVVLVRHLYGVNGLAFGGARTIAVADTTASYDFRVFAHEVGHVLGLDHVLNKSGLMYSGSNGTTLTMEEVLSARGVAESLAGSRK